MSDPARMPASYDAWRTASPPEDEDPCDDCDFHDCGEACRCSCHDEDDADDDLPLGTGDY